MATAAPLLPTACSNQHHRWLLPDRADRLTNKSNVAECVGSPVERRQVWFLRYVGMLIREIAVVCEGEGGSGCHAGGRRQTVVGSLGQRWDHDDWPRGLLRLHIRIGHVLAASEVNYLMKWLLLLRKKALKLLILLLHKLLHLLFLLRVEVVAGRPHELALGYLVDEVILASVVHKSTTFLLHHHH